MSTTRFPLAAAVALALFAAGCSSSKKLRFTGTPAPNVVAGQTYMYNAAVTGSTGAVNYTLQVFPAGMTVNANGAVSWQTDVADVGNHPVTLRATSGSRSGSISWTIQVLQPNPKTDAAAGPEPALAFRGNWRDSVATAGRVPVEAMLAADSAAMFGLPAAFGFTWTDETGTPDLTSESLPELNSWRNVETRTRFLAMLESFVTLVRPQSLLLANEVDPPLATFDAGEWDAWLAVLAEAQALVAALSPETTVVTRPRR